MAEFCFDCFKEMMEIKDEQWRYILTDELELCEGCARYKKIVVKERFLSRLQKTLHSKRKGEDMPIYGMEKGGIIEEKRKG